MVWHDGRAQLDPDGRQQRVEVTVSGGYRPASIVARAGVPLRIVFRRDDHDACTERVVFSAPRLDRRLVASGTTMVDLPAQPAGQIRFTCGMGRYRGRIDLVDAAAPSVVARLGDGLGRLDTPLGTALVLWICSLPLIVLVTILLLDLRAALVAAGLALLAWVIGCLWAFRSSTPAA